MAEKTEACHIIPTEDLKQAAKATTSCPLLENNLEEWIRCCSRRFFPLARRITEDDSLAEDALQKSWIKIFQAAHACRGGPTACSWVHAIVSNVARDIHREDPRRREVPLPEEDQREDPGRSPQDLAHEMELLRLMRAMVDLLPETYRQVVKLRVYQDLSSRETAERLHISPSNVDTRLSRATGLLTRLMDARLGVLQGRIPPDGAPLPIPE